MKTEHFFIIKKIAGQYAKRFKAPLASVESAFMLRGIEIIASLDLDGLDEVRSTRLVTRTLYRLLSGRSLGDIQSETNLFGVLLKTVRSNGLDVGDIEILDTQQDTTIREDLDLERLIQRMTPEEREFVTLTLNGHTIGEIKQITGLDRNAVYRIQRQLRERISTWLQS